jgi:hypothetical protein
VRPGSLPGIVRAAGELLLARLTLAWTGSGNILKSVHLDSKEPVAGAEPIPADVERIAYLIPRVAARLLWRADCLVQALAARRWLASLGHEAQLSLGVRSENGSFQAHAWCIWRGHVVTGGRIDPYVKLERALPKAL